MWREFKRTKSDHNYKNGRPIYFTWLQVFKALQSTEKRDRLIRKRNQPAKNEIDEIRWCMIWITIFQKENINMLQVRIW